MQIGISASTGYLTNDTDLLGVGQTDIGPDSCQNAKGSTNPETGNGGINSRIGTPNKTLSECEIKIPLPKKHL